jgi:uncharacterized membrane protein
MIPLYVMLAAIALARVAGLVGVPILDDWPGAPRAGLAVMFVFTGVAHFTRTREDLVRMVPPQFPNPALLVTLTGIAEIAGAIGLFTLGFERLAAWCLMALLVAMFPANVYASRTAQTIAGRRHTPMVIRAPVQIAWIALLWWSMP